MGVLIRDDHKLGQLMADFTEAQAQAKRFENVAADQLTRFVNDPEWLFGLAAASALDNAAFTLRGLAKRIRWEANRRAP